MEVMRYLLHPFAIRKIKLISKPSQALRMSVLQVIKLFHIDARFETTRAVSRPSFRNKSHISRHAFKSYAERTVNTSPCNFPTARMSGHSR